jgi:replicative DNA helicase
MALVQIGRDAEKQKSTEAIPKLHHLRESDAIAQDADVVFILHRERDKAGLFNESKPPALVVAKARNDEPTAMLLGFETKFVRFSNNYSGETFAGVYRQ